MKVTIELRHGPNHNQVFGPDVLDKQIEVLERHARGEYECGDSVLMLDTASILRAIQRGMSGVRRVFRDDEAAAEDVRASRLSPRAADGRVR